MRNIKLNTSHIKVGFEELFYDLIFVVIISKMAEMFILSPHINFNDIFLNIVFFLVLLFSWRYRLLHNSKVHLLSEKYDQNVAKMEISSYFELLGIIFVLHSVETITFNSILIILFIVFIATILTISQVRHFLFGYFIKNGDDSALLEDMSKRKSSIYINMNYLVERYMIITILFIGEIILLAFEDIDNNYIFILAVIIIVFYFNQILKTVKKFLVDLDHESFTERTYRDVNHFFTVLITTLMLVISYIEYLVKYQQVNYIILIIFLSVFISIFIKKRKRLDI